MDEIVLAFTALSQNAALRIAGFEYGVNNSPEGLEKGLTHCFTVTFARSGGRRPLPCATLTVFAARVGVQRC